MKFVEQPRDSFGPGQLDALLRAADPAAGARSESLHDPDQLLVHERGHLRGHTLIAARAFTQAGFRSVCVRLGSGLINLVGDLAGTRKWKGRPTPREDVSVEDALTIYNVVVRRRFHRLQRAKRNLGLLVYRGAVCVCGKVVGKRLRNDHLLAAFTGAARNLKLEEACLEADRLLSYWSTVGEIVPAGGHEYRPAWNMTCHTFSGKVTLSPAWRRADGGTICFPPLVGQPPAVFNAAAAFKRSKTELQAALVKASAASSGEAKRSIQWAARELGKSGPEGQARARRVLSSLPTKHGSDTTRLDLLDALLTYSRTLTPRQRASCERFAYGLLFRQPKT